MHVCQLKLCRLPPKQPNFIIFNKITEVSHLKERKEHNCLNCNAIIHGRYCHICGQENIEPKETAWHLVSHFFQDITHFDGKFFSTLKLLITRPGFLSREYMNGRRASYLNPIRMYVFTSAFFFLIFFSLFKVSDNTINTKTTVNNKSLEEIAKMDSTTFAAFTANINKEEKRAAVPMNRSEFQYYLDTANYKSGGIHFSFGKRYKSVAEYDSLIKTGAVNDGWLSRLFTKKELEINQKYNYNAKAQMKAFADILLHSVPQIMFISLPLFALLLKLLYIRRKNFYYVNHAIFSIHVYIFSFITMLVIFGINEINKSLHSWLLGTLSSILTAGVFFYLYKAMRNFYQQQRGKTILKFFLLSLLTVIMFVIVFLAFIFLSLFKL